MSGWNSRRISRIILWRRQDYYPHLVMVTVMSFILFDNEDEKNDLQINDWSWHAIVEIIRRLDLLDEGTVDGLHQQWGENGLTHEEARLVASAIEDRVLPTLDDAEQILLDGQITKVPDNSVFHPVNTEKNYSTTYSAIRMFVDYCKSCSGFKIC